MLESNDQYRLTQHNCFKTLHLNPITVEECKIYSSFTFFYTPRIILMYGLFIQNKTELLKEIEIVSG